ncbi:MAG: hypothetical protein ACRYGP_01270 [Janthinobacterium lividum]
MAGRFAFSEPPIPGESLLGFIARNADIHGVDKVGSALMPAGLENPKTEAFATAYEEQVDVVAALFMTTPEEVRSRMYLPWVGGDGVEVDFHGTRVRPKYLRWAHRRFSPTSLRVSGHHRALWDLNVLSFCPESKEVLVAECPECKKSLGWRYTLGVTKCEWCEADLTKVSGVPVRCDDMDALDFVCDLVNPDPVRRTAALRRVPSRLSALDAGGLFEFVINLVCMMVTKPEAATMVRIQFKQDTGVVTPESLAKAGRVILGWPETMHALTAEVRSKAHLRPGSWGTSRELRPVLWLTKVESIPLVAREAVSEIIDASISGAGNVAQRVFNLSDEYLTKYEVYNQFGFKSGTLDQLCDLDLLRHVRRHTAGKPTILIRREDVADLRAEMGDATHRPHVADMLGVDFLAVERLAEAGLLSKTGPATAAMTHGGDPYRTSSLAELRGKLLALAQGPVRSDTWMTLSDVAASSVAPVVPWTGLIEAVLSRRVNVMLVSNDPDLPLMRRLGVGSEGLDLVAGLPYEKLPESDGRLITTFEAGAILEVMAASVSAVTKGKSLTRIGSGYHALMVDEVLSFRSRSISAREVARRTGNQAGRVSARLGSLGVPLTFASAGRKVLFWDRAAAEGAFDHLRDR